MKQVLLFLTIACISTGCSRLQNSEVLKTGIESDFTASVAPQSKGPQPTLSPDVHNLVITDSNFSVDEIIVTEGENLVLSVRNQLEEPINVRIDALGVQSEDIEFGEAVEIQIPTDTAGEYEMYSSLGNQRAEGFTALVIVEEKTEE